MHKLETLKNKYSENLHTALLHGMRYVRSLNENQAQELFHEIEGNAFWYKKGLFVTDSKELIEFLAKVNDLIERRLVRNGFAAQFDEDGLIVTNNSTPLTLPQYELIHLKNTDFTDFVSLDFCHAYFVDYKALEILSYCEGDIVVKTADSLQQLKKSMERIIEESQLRKGTIVHNDALAKAYKKSQANM